MYKIICIVLLSVSFCQPSDRSFNFYLKIYLTAVCRFSENLPSVSVESSVLLNVLQRNGFRCKDDTNTCQVCPRGTYSRGDGVSKGCLPCPAGNTTGMQYYSFALNFNTDTPFTQTSFITCFKKVSVNKVKNFNLIYDSSLIYLNCGE